MNLEPRQVPRSSVKTWFVEAVKLIRRKPVEFTVLALIPIILAKVDQSGLLANATFAAILACGCLVAKSSDHSQPTLHCFRAIDKHTWIRLFMVGSALPIIMASLNLLTGSVELSELAKIDPFAEEVQAMSRQQFLIILSITFAAMVITLGVVFRVFRFLWFFWTLCLLPDMPVSEAFKQSLDATELNRFVVWPFVVSSLLLILTFVVPVLFVPWFAITTSIMYVSYRDVWLQRTQSEPEVRNVSSVRNSSVATANF